MSEPSLNFICPVCGASAGEKCESSTGYPRVEPHKERIEFAEGRDLDVTVKLKVIEIEKPNNPATRKGE